jgi:hypothetical protein
MIDQDSAPEDAEDRFYAQFDSREVVLMTLDVLQEAFEAGKIHGNTFVCREGEDEWLTLAVVAGLGEEEEESESALVAPPVSGTRPPMPARRPEESRPPLPERRPDIAQARPPMPERRPDIGQTRPPMPNRSADVQGTVETRPPMPERRAPMNTEPAARFQPSVSPVAVLTASKPLTFAPVTSNFDYAGVDLDETALRPKRRWGVILAAAAALALVGGGAVFALNGGTRALGSATPSTAALQAAASKSQATLTPSNLESQPSEPAAAPAVPSTPEPAAAPANSSEAAKGAPELNDEMKQALLAADKTHQSKHAAKVKAHAAAAPRRAQGASSGGFKSGGSAYDPLNGKL